jgi:hypothetical protein
VRHDVQHDVQHDEHRDLDERADDRPTLRVDACRSRIAAIDSAIEVLRGRAALTADEAVDVLLDLRTRLTFSTAMVDSWNR